MGIGPALTGSDLTLANRVARPSTTTRVEDQVLHLHHHRRPLGLVMYVLTQGPQFVGLDLLPAATLSLLLSFTPVVVTLGSGRTAATGAAI